MPNRIVRDELLQSDRWLDLPSPTERLAYMVLLLKADDFGLLEGGATRLFRQWRDACNLRHVEDADKLLGSLHEQDLVRIYEVDGKRYLFIPRFRQFTRAKKSRCPAPPPALVQDEPADSKVVWLSDPKRYVPKKPQQEKSKACEKNAVQANSGSNADEQHKHCIADEMRSETETETETYKNIPRAKALGRDAPKIPRAKLKSIRGADPESWIWEAWMEIPGVTSRAILGKLVKQYGKERVGLAVLATDEAQPADPHSYIVGVLRQWKGRSIESLKGVVA